MSNINSDKAIEKIWDEIDEHIESYFESGDNDNELVRFIYDNPKVHEYVFRAIAESKFGEKIAEKAFNDLPEGEEEPLD